MANDLTDFLSVFYRGMPAGGNINTVGTSSFGSNKIQAGNPIKPASKAGADNGLPFAIDWWGDGSNVSGNPSLVDVEPESAADPTHGFGEAISGSEPIAALIEGIEGTFARVAIIILGFIFVAVGLSMFKPGTIAAVGKAAL